MYVPEGSAVISRLAKVKTQLLDGISKGIFGSHSGSGPIWGDSGAISAIDATFSLAVAYWFEG
jgi:hypothetical protein